MRQRTIVNNRYPYEAASGGNAAFLQSVAESQRQMPAGAVSVYNYLISTYLNSPGYTGDGARRPSFFVQSAPFVQCPVTATLMPIFCHIPIC